HGDRTKASYPVNTGYCWPNDKAVWDCTLTSISHPAVKHDQHYLAIDRVYRKVFLDGREPMQGDCPLGVLTFKGYVQQETNGKILNQAYVKTGFLKQNFSYAEMFIRSDAQSLIRGMYPPVSVESDRSHVVDINTMDRTFDDIEPNSILCPMLAQYQKEFYKSPMFLNHFYNVTLPLLHELQKALQSNRTLGLDDMDSITDCVHTHQCHQFKVPDTITADLFDRMVADIGDRNMMQFTYPSREKFSKAGIGFLVNEMWQAMQRAMKGTGHKFLLYSGHDYTISPMLVAFNISDGQWPPYASMLRFELLQRTSAWSHSMSDLFAVRVVYNEKELKPPFCDASPCSMAQFEKYINTIIPQDPNTECKVTDPSVLEGPLGRMRRWTQSGRF
ncbi:hypothetical protein QZH41_019490, partial [Actinostola sp. cb2023]